MCSCRAAGRTDIAYHLSLKDAVARLHGIAGKVGIQSLRPISMRDDNVVAIASIPPALARYDHGACRRRDYRSTVWGTKVDAIIPMETLRPARAARYRMAIITDIRRTSGTLHDTGA